MESSQWGNWNNLLCRKVSFLTAPHCQFLGVGQEFEDTKGAIRIRISKKNRQHNGQKEKYKRTNKLWSRHICICGILYFKLNGIDAINEITKPKLAILYFQIVLVSVLTYSKVDRGFEHRSYQSNAYYEQEQIVIGSESE
jgi:hypothetical protein